MKLLVFAHTPPPHHGQSYMVQLMLEGFGGDCVSRPAAPEPCPPTPDSQILCYHVNARMSDDMEDIGGIRPGKILRLLRHCATAIGYRFRYGVTTLYYVPAPAKKSAIVRDWIVMLLVRPFFKCTIFHWHAFGLGHWAAGGTKDAEMGRRGDSAHECQGTGERRILNDAATDAEQRPGLQCSMLNEELDANSKLKFKNSPFGAAVPLARWLTRRLLGGADLSIVLTEYNRADAALLQPKKIAVVPNGIPDPCPDFAESVLPARKARAALFKECLVLNDKCSMEDQAHQAKSRSSEFKIQNSKFQKEDVLFFRVLFLAHCTREKGLFDTLDAVALANAQLTSQVSGFRFHLTVAGSFMNEEERREFDERISQPDLQLPASQPSTINHQLSAVTAAGFVSGEEKSRLLRESDAFCFPTYYSGETFGLVLAEAMAFGLPVLTTNWRGLPELLPPGYPWIVEPRSPEQLASALHRMPEFENAEELRARFLSTYVLHRHLDALSQAMAAGT